MKTCTNTSCSDPRYPVVAKGLCRRCYNRQHAKKRTQKFLVNVMKSFNSEVRVFATKCKHKDRPHCARGMCRTCYIRVRRQEKKKGIWIPKTLADTAAPDLSPRELERLQATAASRQSAWDDLEGDES
jgi:hypothetical protein